MNGWTRRGVIAAAGIGCAAVQAHLLALVLMLLSAGLAPASAAAIPRAAALGIVKPVKSCKDLAGVDLAGQTPVWAGSDFYRPYRALER